MFYKVGELMYQENSLFYNYNQTPLADRIRPLSLNEFVGQKHLIGEGKVLRVLIETDKITSLIFWGPPGVGKTTLAMIIANVVLPTPGGPQKISEVILSVSINTLSTFPSPIRCF